MTKYGVGTPAVTKIIPELNRILFKFKIVVY